MSKEDLQKYALSSGETKNDGLICEFKDGLIYKNNPLWTSSIQIKQCKSCYTVMNLFVLTHWDTKFKNVKSSALYFVLGNLPRKERSMLSSINLEILYKTIFIEKYGHESVLYV